MSKLQPATPYDNFSDKACEELTNSHFTTRHDLHDDFLIEHFNEVQSNHVDVVLTIRTGIKEPTFADVCGVHITKLTAVAFVKDYDYLLIKCRMVFRVLLDEGRKFLNCCNNNLGFVIS